jgi:hypothetical protein
MLQMMSVSPRKECQSWAKRIICIGRRLETIGRVGGELVDGQIYQSWKSGVRRKKSSGPWREYVREESTSHYW